MSRISGSAAVGGGPVSLPWLLEHVSPPWGDSWAATFEELAACRHDRDTLRVLCGEWERDGRFRSPVVVDAGTMTLLDGRHRVWCAVVVGAAAVDMRLSPPPAAATAPTAVMPGGALEVTFGLSDDVVVPAGADPGDVWFGDDGSGEPFHELVCCVRSFPLPSALWVECVDLRWDGCAPVGVFAETAGSPLEAGVLRSVLDDRLLVADIPARVRRVRSCSLPAAPVVS